MSTVNCNNYFPIVYGATKNTRSFFIYKCLHSILIPQSILSTRDPCGKPKQEEKKKCNETTKREHDNFIANRMKFLCSS
jgi:hypothetical protein